MEDGKGRRKGRGMSVRGMILKTHVLCVLLFKHFSLSASICANLRAVLDSVAALPRWEIRGSSAFVAVCRAVLQAAFSDVDTISALSYDF
jgi:hypothetical protein